ncbi:uncharacterized protein LOC124927974 [Impatiens glandulifera]|uniref:uncharacterized protein LOC124927974 n=1 Tax=Impatiens glandulifera TaxID=253017 RepID=UPI001FB08C44|nr:uncharacterized protein LOC124927974 [Impatiens glandulifera]
MANSINKFSKSKSFFFSIDRNYPTVIDSSMYELDESDVWNSPVDFQSAAAAAAASKTATSWQRRSKVAVRSASVPVDVPEWSKRRSVDVDVDVDLFGDGVVVPPHVLVARELDNNKATAVAYSVYEGLGRTLKGRDLSKVRNAIWEITGFQD